MKLEKLESGKEVQLPECGDPFLVYYPEGKYCYFGVVVKSGIQPQCRQYGKSQKILSKKSFFDVFRKKKEDLPKHHHFSSYSLRLDYADFFGFLLPIFDVPGTDYREIFCLEEIEQEKELLYIGKEDILGALSMHGFGSFESYIAQLCDGSDEILKKMTKKPFWESKKL